MDFLSAGTNYTLAEAMVITFMVNNFQNETFQEMAVTWEKAFLDFMKNYSSPLLNITYTAQVGICNVSFLFGLNY